MSNPAQGAVGAETMTGTLWCMHISGPDGVHAAPDFWTALSWAAELNAAVAARAIKQGWAGDDNWPLAQATVQPWPWSAERHAGSLATELATRASQNAALASPRADSDEPHFGYLFHNPDTGYEWSESHPIESGEVEDAENVRPATAKALHEELIEAWGALEDARADLYTPAQPAGAVPDSLRALIREIVNATYAMTAAPLGTEVARLYRAAQPLAEFISTHPAGQSAGSGAEARPVAWLLEKPDGETHLTECRPRDDWKDGTVTPLYPRQERPRTVEFMCEGQVCTAEVPTPRPAPDSTRTGDEGMEDTVERMAWIILANLRTDVSVADIRRKLDEEQSGRFGLGRSWSNALDTARRQARALLAARPAAPEAQGAWRERAATEIDAIAQQWGTEGDADGRAYAKTLAAILRAERPAPPASSGQGGR